MTIFFYNPNISPESEYVVRKEDILRLADVWGFDVMETSYDHQAWREMVRGYEDEPECGNRCLLCYRMRLAATARMAKQQGFDRFATTLTLSPHKHAETINAIGHEEAEKVGVTYLASDFKKRDGYPESIRLSKAFGLYRQHYCGCIFSRSMQSPKEKKR